MNQTGNNSLYSSTLTNVPVDETFVCNNSLSDIRKMTSDGGNNVVYCSISTLYIGYSSNGGTSFTILPSPAIFVDIFYSGSVLWAITSTTVYKSLNNGTSWIIVLSGLSIKSSAINLSNTLLYISCTTGEVVLYRLI
jgi:hypothetical protein